MGQGKSQARLADLTPSKNHHTPSQALGGGGGGCPSAPRLQRKKWCGSVGGMLASWAQGSYKSLTFSITPLPPSVSMQARGWEGSLRPSLPLRGGRRRLESGEAMRQLPLGAEPRCFITEIRRTGAGQSQ